jgi:hypothetical protein
VKILDRLLEKLINCRAYQLWERAGQPSGRDNEFRLVAQAELSVSTELTISVETTTALEKVRPDLVE